MKKKNNFGSEYWLYSLLALGVDLKDLPDDVMSGKVFDEYIFESDYGFKSKSDVVEWINIENLASANKRQKTYIAHGFIDDEYYEFHILCPKCNSDKFGQDGTDKNGDIKFKCNNCTNPKGNPTTFYLKPFINLKIDKIRNAIATWLIKKYFSQNFAAWFLYVHSTTINNWVKKYEEMDEEDKAAFWEIESSKRYYWHTARWNLKEEKQASNNIDYEDLNDFEIIE